MELKTENLKLNLYNEAQADEYFTISFYFKNRTVTIATVGWDVVRQNGYIKTIDNLFQTYVASFETFSNFIYLVDAAYDYLYEEHNKKMDPELL